MKHRSAVRAAVAVAAIGLAMTACTGTGAAPSSDGGEKSKTIRYLVEQPEDAATLKKLETHIGDFEKSSGIDVKLGDAARHQFALTASGKYEWSGEAGSQRPADECKPWLAGILGAAGRVGEDDRVAADG